MRVCAGKYSAVVGVWAWRWFWRTWRKVWRTVASGLLGSFLTDVLRSPLQGSHKKFNFSPIFISRSLALYSCVVSYLILLSYKKSQYLGLHEDAWTRYTHPSFTGPSARLKALCRLGPAFLHDGPRDAANLYLSQILPLSLLCLCIIS